MNFTDERTALTARCNSAIALAQVVEPSYELVIANVNTQTWEPDAAGYYIRIYWISIAGSVLSFGDAYNRIDRNLFTDIIIPTEIGDTLISSTWEAIEPAFVTNGDGLQFEAAPILVPGASDGVHFLATGRFPYYWDRQRP